MCVHGHTGHAGSLLGPQSDPCSAQGSLTKPQILWSAPHTHSGTVREVGGGLLVGTKDTLKVKARVGA